MIISEDAIFVLRTIAAIQTLDGDTSTRADGEELKLSGFCLDGGHWFIPASVIDKARSAVALLDASGPAPEIGSASVELLARVMCKADDDDPDKYWQDYKRQAEAAAEWFLSFQQAS